MHVIFLFLEEQRKAAKAQRLGCHKQWHLVALIFVPGALVTPSEVLTGCPGFPRALDRKDRLSLLL